MEKGRKNKKLSQRHREKHPFCVYCGGVVRATQLDHVPPKSIFSLKRRPQDLEFSVCDLCHKGTRKIDLVAALTARSWPSLITEEEKTELALLMGGVLRNVPPVRDELARGFGKPQIVSETIAGLVGSDAIAMDFTVRRAVIDAFAARVAMALYYKFFGRILGESGGVWVRTYTNVENIGGEGLPSSLDGVLGPSLALVQKGLKAEEAFQYSVRKIDDYDGLIAFSAFRQSFANLAIVYPEVKDFPVDIQSDVFRPGFLIGYPL